MIKGLGFANTWAVWLIPPLFVILALVLVEMKRREAFLRAFGDLPLLSRFSRLGPEWPRRLRPLFLSLALIAVAVALARPVLAPKSGGEGPRRSLDVVLLLDVSRSMGAEDYAPKLTRLGKAKGMILEALPDLAGARVGIVTFAGAPFRQAPLTGDDTALRYILTNWVFIESAPPGGSDIVRGIRTAVRLFEGRWGERVVLLFSDGGEAQPEDLRSALIEARSKGIRIFTFGLGGPVPSKIPRYDRDGRFSGWLTLQGEVATTRLDEGILQQVATETGGAYARVLSGRELGRTLTGLKIPDARSPAGPRELFQWPLAAALLLLFLETVGVGLKGWTPLTSLSRKASQAASRRGGSPAGAWEHPLSASPGTGSASSPR